MMHTHVGLPAATPTDAVARYRERIARRQLRQEGGDREDFHRLALTAGRRIPCQTNHLDL